MDFLSLLNDEHTLMFYDGKRFNCQTNKRILHIYVQKEQPIQQDDISFYQVIVCYKPFCSVDSSFKLAYNLNQMYVYIHTKYYEIIKTKFIVRVKKACKASTMLPASYQLHFENNSVFVGQQPMHTVGCLCFDINVEIVNIFERLQQYCRLDKIQIMVVSLLDRPKRRSVLEPTLQGMKFQYFWAVDGFKINVYNHQEKPGQFLVQYKQQFYVHNPSKRQKGMSYGEFGCALSHFYLYEQLIKHPQKEYFFVIEDDAYIESMDELVEQLLYLPSSFDYIMMHNEAIYDAPKISQYYNYKFGSNLQNTVNMTHGYIIHKSFAQKMYDEFVKEGLNYPADDVINKFIRETNVLTYTPYCRVVGTQQATSDIWNIHKPNESYVNIVWDKPVYEPKYIIPSSMSPWARLGNQMFQYAIALAMAFQHKGRVGITEDKCQLSLFQHFKQLDYDVLHPNVLKHPDVQLVKEAHEFTFQPSILGCKHKLINLDGYFQNAMYFEGIKDVIVDVFQFHPHIEEEATSSLRKYMNYQVEGHVTVAVHLRITDAPQDRNEDFIYYIWTPEELKSMIQRIQSELASELASPSSKITFLFFSNDIPRCKAQFQIDQLQVHHVWVEQNEAVSLAIMMKCDHFIISASTYSWWAAWLKWVRNKCTTKVFMPKIWFNPLVERVRNNDVSGLYIEEWCKV